MILHFRKRSEIKKFETKIFEENSVEWRGELYEIGSSVFLKPCTYKFHSTRLKRNEADVFFTVIVKNL